MTTHDQIVALIRSHPIVLFMKGTPESPLCGFSRAVVQVLNRLEAAFVGIDVLEDPELRAGLKTFSDWPTFPQLYIREEFVGGCDIVKALYLSGELAQLLQSHGLIAHT